MTPTHATPDGNLVRRLAAAIDAVLRPLLPPGTGCALLDFPNHANVGDSAIWLGETAWLRRNGSPVVHACDCETYSRERLAAQVGDGPILLHGGGNLGDFWGHHQRFREQVIQDFPGNKIIQLPQTIYFLDEWGVGEARRVFDAHRDFTLLCRDRTSLDFARREFAGPCFLCPDLAFALGELEKPVPPGRDVVWLARTDAESAGAPLPGGADVEPTDWLDEPPTPTRERNRLLTDLLCRNPADWREVHASLTATYDVLAGERLARGCRVLSHGRAVVSDRLHGHILCLLLGIPHVVLDNNYGKVRSFFQTWTRGSPLAHWAESPAEALALATALARPAPA